MLLAVEGGGFFSSSATGYSKGLSLLLLGHQDKPMKVSPWNQYHLVDQQTNNPPPPPPLPPDLHLASHSHPVSGGCSAFFCFTGRRASAGFDLPPKKVVDNILPDESPVCHHTVGDLCVKSSLKKSAHCIPTCVDDDLHGDAGRTQTRRVRWTDSCGKELAEIREFECSELSDEEFEDENERSCACTIM